MAFTFDMGTPYHLHLTAEKRYVLECGMESPHHLTVSYTWGISSMTWYNATGNDFIYDIVEDECTIYQYIGTNATIKIPDTIKDSPVTQLASTAFNYASVTAVSIPESVTIID